MAAVTRETLDWIKETIFKKLPAYLSNNGMDCKVIQCEAETLDQNDLAYHAGSTIYRARLSLEENGKLIIHNTLVKVMPSTDFMRQVMNSKMQFEDEHAMYHDVIPLLLEKVAHYTTDTDRLEWWRPEDLFPRCFYSSTGSYKEAMIVLEDLTLKSYKTRGDTATLAMEYSDVLTAIRALARFHALSYDLKLREPDCFKNNVANKVKDTRLFVTEPGKEEWGQYMEFLHTAALIPCSRLEAQDKEGRYKSAIQKLRSMMDDPAVLNRLLTPVEPLAVVCHGDYVMNNMLFKDNEVKMVDFQNAMYSSPFLDLATMLYMHGGGFINRWDELLEEYHNCLIRCLGRQPKEFSLDAFRAEFVRCGLFGYMISVGFIITVGNNPDKKSFEDQVKETPEDPQDRKKHVQQLLKLENEDIAQRVVALLRETIDREIGGLNKQENI